jgi:hypothetical protein
MNINIDIPTCNASINIDYFSTYIPRNVSA